MLLRDLLVKVSILKLIGSIDIKISDLQFDSRLVKNNNIFFAIKGNKNDGHDYLNDVIKKGIVAVVVEDIPKNTYSSVTYIKVDNTKEAMGIIAANFFTTLQKKSN